MMLYSVVLLLTVGGALSQSTHRPLPDLETRLMKSGHYSMFLDLLGRSGMMDDLKNMPNLTLFAPTNAGLSQMDANELNDLKNNQDDLREFINYHLTPITYHTMGRDNDVVLTSNQNDLPIRINVYKQLHTISAEGVNITEKDQRVSNGFIQGIDGVMWAPEGTVVDLIKNNDELSQSAAFIAQEQLENALEDDKNITVFVPTDEAWEDLAPEVLTFLQHNPAALKEVLLYHVVKKTTLYKIGMSHYMTFLTADGHKDVLMMVETEDGEFMINDAMLNDVDISATNGVIHTIEKVLIPSSVLIQIEDQGLGHHLG